MLMAALILLLLAVPTGLVLLLGKMKPRLSGGQIAFILLYILAFLVLVVVMLTNSYEYTKALDPIDDGYSPFSDRHFLTLLVHFILFHTAALLVWRRGNMLPPLVLVSCLAMLITGSAIAGATTLQLMYHAGTDELNNAGTPSFGIVFPLLSILLAAILLVKVIQQEGRERATYTYSNKALNWLNALLGRQQGVPLWALLLALPIFTLIAIILLLFGQDTDSIVKVFTETTTWTFSRHTHPPPLDHTGHYLCTVAASGSPNIVKPLRLGMRGGRQIIVNRQLLISNAFEELIAEGAPHLHRAIRGYYDQHGPGLARRINTPAASNITYCVMKPLEWAFLLCLYVFCCKPEARISRQYPLR